MNKLNDGTFLREQCSENPWHIGKCQKKQQQQQPQQTACLMWFAIYSHIFVELAKKKKTFFSPVDSIQYFMLMKEVNVKRKSNKT